MDDSTEVHCEESNSKHNLIFWSFGGDPIKVGHFCLTETRKRRKKGTN
jgi:hypothetical protein